MTSNGPRLLLVVALVVAACGGSDGDSGADPIDDASSTTVGVNTTSPDNSGTDGPPPSEADEPGDNGEAGAAAGEATVAVEDDIYTFVQADNVCTPDELGLGIFRARMISADGSGPALTVVLASEDDPDIQSLIEISGLGFGWLADSDRFPESGVDDFQVDGNHAEGTATFIGAEGDSPVAGTFTLTCAG